MSDPVALSQDPGGRPFGLHRGFFGLALAESFERFAVAGVKSMLTLFLLDHLLRTSSDATLGLTRWRAAFESLFGTQSDIAFASQLYGLQSALLYLSVPLGGMIGDLVAGRHRVAVAGAVMMAGGGVAMAGGYLFLPGLLLFAMGAGWVKGSLAAQVGALFEDEPGRRRGFAVYLGFLNLGVFLGPLACGALASTLGWRFGFGAAACAAGAALAVYGLTTSLRPSAGHAALAAPAERVRWSGEAARKLPLLALAMAAVFLCFAAYEQISNIVLVWAEQHVDLRIGGWRIPTPWLVSADGLLTILLIPCSEALFRRAERRGISPGPLARIALGCGLCASGYLVLAAAAMSGGEASLGWLFLYLLLVDSAIVLVWPAGLSLITAQAPRGMAGLLVGTFYLHGFFASLWTGASGAFYEPLGPSGFWLVHAGIALAGLGLLVVAAPPLVRLAGIKASGSELVQPTG